MCQPKNDVLEPIVGLQGHQGYDRISRPTHSGAVAIPLCTHSARAIAAMPDRKPQAKYKDASRSTPQRIRKQPALTCPPLCHMLMPRGVHPAAEESDPPSIGSNQVQVAAGTPAVRCCAYALCQSITQRPSAAAWCAGDAQSACQQPNSSAASSRQAASSKQPAAMQPSSQTASSRQPHSQAAKQPSSKLAEAEAVNQLKQPSSGNNLLLLEIAII